MPDKPKIMSDFDSTLIKQNSLNILSKKVAKYYLKNGKFLKLIKNLPLIIIRLKEIYFPQTLSDAAMIDNTDIMIKKARMLLGIPYSIYKEHTIPELEISQAWIEQCLTQKIKYNIDEPINIVSRNGIQEIEDFFSYSSKKNMDLLKNKSFLKKVSKITDKQYKPNYYLKKENISNEEILKFFGIEIKIIANILRKQKVILNSKEDYIYTGIIESNHELGVIERKNKAIIYQNNIVLADKEETFYKTWAKEFICVNH